MLSKCEEEINAIREAIYEEMKGKTSHEYTQIANKALRLKTIENELSQNCISEVVAVASVFVLCAWLNDQRSFSFGLRKFRGL